MRWITAYDLRLWAGRLDCEGTLPELLRRLVHATVDAPDHVAFPILESVQTRGWDGIVHASVGNEYVPDGWSGWEVSKRGDIKVKADQDFDKRTADSESLDRTKSAFVFVTPRNWDGKEDWITAKKAMGAWADVRAYDADDLEQWLERADAVGAWLARILRKYPDGVLSIDDFWAEYSFATIPPFTPEIVLAGRKADAKHAGEWLTHGTGMFAVVADSPREAIALLVASITLLGEDEQARIRSRFLLSEDPNVLRQLIATATNLTVGWLATDTSLVGEALRQGHRVVLPVRADQARANSLTMSRPDPEALLAALKSTGLAEDRAKALLRETGLSITGIHCLLNTAPSPPAWATPDPARELFPAVLANAWDEQRQQDQGILAGVAGTDYATLSAAMARWSHVPDAPVQQAGTVWTIRAPRYAWHFLSPYLTRHDIDRFRVALIAVLGVVDPSLDLPPEERWLANIHAKEFPHSPWLRQGLSETLVLIGLTPTVAGYRGSDIAIRIVGETLEDGWQRWYSLASLLPLLAEAAPATFLRAIEDFLERDPDGIENLFVKLGPMHGDHAAGLLWALELLAWYPENLTRVTTLLGRLARNHKRPQEILRAIFLTWLPQTAAPIQDRTTALSVLLKLEPRIGWTLLMNLWPQVFDTGAYHYEPRWRDKPAMRPTTVGDRINAANAIIGLAMDSAVGDPERLVDLIRQIGTTPPEARARLRDLLNAFAIEERSDTSRLLLWNVLREETNKHRHFHEADWALPEAEVALFDPITDALKPEDLISRHAWLFQSHYPMLPLPDPNLSVTDAELARLREEAAQQIIAESGAQAISTLARAVEFPSLVGISAASVNADEAAMLAMLESEIENVRRCGMGYAWERYRRNGMAWIDRTLGDQQHWDANTRTALLLAIPSERTTWDRVEQQNVGPEYWRRTRVYLGRDAPPDDSAYAIAQLLSADQVPQAFEQASMNAQNTPTAALTQTLDRVLQVLQDPNHTVWHLASHNLTEILGALDKREDIDVAAIARYEWAFLPLLRHGRTLRLHNHLADDPDLFAHMIASIYRREDGEPRQLPTEEMKARAHQAYELLSTWYTIPGIAADATIDKDKLLAWIEAARVACEGRRDACDNHIGKVLARAPLGSDGVWPHESVRAIIEHLCSRALEGGFLTGVLDKRGVHARDPLAGGVQERALAAQYRAWAQALAAASPRTSAVLSEVAEDYESFGHHEDINAEHLRLEH